MNLPTDYSLESRHAVVCGSTQGIGLACATRFAELGATCTLIARNESALQSTVAALPTPAAQSHHFAVADFADQAQVRSAIESTLKNHGDVHILVNNTGGPAPGPIVDADPHAFTRAIDMHVGNNQILLQAVLPGMKAAKFGRIMNIISTSVKEPIPGLGISNTTRWAVAAWAKTVAGEVAKFGITVNNILPGFTDTARLGSIIKNKASAGNTSESAVADAMIAKIPMARLGEAKEIAAAAGFLASPAASYITGINVPVDGGRLACM